MINKSSKIYVAGHKGLVGSSVVKLLKKRYNRIITADKSKLNLLDKKSRKIF